MSEWEERSVLVKIERAGGLKDIYKPYDTEEEGYELMSYLRERMEEDGIVTVDFSYKGDIDTDVVEETHTFRASAIKDIQMVVVWKEMLRCRRSG